MKISFGRLVFPIIGAGLIGAAILQSHSISQVQGAGSVRASKAAPQPEELRVDGRLATYPGEQSAVGTDVGGTVTHIYVKEGDAVRKGELIVELRSDDLAASLAEAQSQVAEAEADVQLDRVELNRAQTLWDEKVGTRQALDRSQRDLESAEARRATSRQRCGASKRRWLRRASTHRSMAK